MKTRQKYRKLHTFFVKVFADLLHWQLHQHNQVPTDGRQMLKCLEEHLPKLHHCQTYYEVISNCEFIPNEQNKILFPADWAIDVQKLDMAMYIKINRLLDGEKGFCWSYVNAVRSYVSYIPMVELICSASEEDFTIKFIWLKKEFALQWYFVEFAVWGWEQDF